MPKQSPSQRSSQSSGAAAHLLRRVIATRPVCRILLLALLLAFAGGAKMSAQLSASGAIPGYVPTRYNPPGVQPTDHSQPLRDTSGSEDQKLLQMRNAARQGSLVSDASKLLRLAGELRTEVASSNNSTLTPAQLHKLAQIEKLAHKVRVEMAISVVDSQGQMLSIR